MLRFMLPFAAMITSLPLHSQQPVKKNDIYFEFLGNGIGPSLNYERGISKNQQIRFRVGVGYFSGNQRFRFSFPAGISYLVLLKNNTSFLDAGIGITNSDGKGFSDEYVHADSTIPIDNFWPYRVFSLVPSIGFRKHTKNNWMWRINFTPIINEVRTMPWGGVSIGKRF